MCRAFARTTLTHSTRMVDDAVFVERSVRELRIQRDAILARLGDCSLDEHCPCHVALWVALDDVRFLLGDPAHGK